MKCPGQDLQYWKPGDIFEVPCPACGQVVEFFKDDSAHRYPSCGEKFRNPRIDLGCLKWCKFAAQCSAGEQVPEKDPWGQHAQLAGSEAQPDGSGGSTH